MAVQFTSSRALAAVPLTPLIDVVFLLLIFFLVATQFAEEDRELDVVLPSASEARPLVAEPSEVFINIDQEGRYYMGGKLLAIDEVEAALQQAVVNNPVNQSVILRADKRVEFQFVVDAMNVCNKVGVENYTVTTKGTDE